MGDSNHKLADDHALTPALWLAISIPWWFLGILAYHLVVEYRGYVAVPLLVAAAVVLVIVAHARRHAPMMTSRSALSSANLTSSTGRSHPDCSVATHDPDDATYVERQGRAAVHSEAEMVISDHLSDRNGDDSTPQNRSRWS